MSTSVQDVQATPANTDLSFWNSRWEANQIGFHRKAVADLFGKHLLKELDPKSNEQKLVVFPLCGKTLDMKAVLDAGHRVVGIEGVLKAVQTFFEEHEIAYTVEHDEENKYQIYQGTDRPITIYCGDFFAFSKKALPPVDYIWDRGGLVAIPVDDREKYRDVLLNMMHSGRTKFYEVAVNYDDVDMKGPPHCLTDDHVKNLFGSTCSIELLEVHDETEEYNSRNQQKPLSFIEERLHLITKK